jgi:hypothetical protein
MSTTNTQASRLLDELMARLDQAVREDGPRSPQAQAGVDGQSGADGLTGIASQTGPASQVLPDAIDREIAASPRRTAVTRLRQSEVVEQFRRELETQSLTVTTVTAFLQVLQQALPLLLAR